MEMIGGWSHTTPEAVGRIERFHNPAALAGPVHQSSVIGE
jgi:hypothetical protein